MSLTIGPGTRVECIRKGRWPDGFGQYVDGPAFKSKWLVTAAALEAHGMPGYWIQLRDWPGDIWFDAGQFRPLDEEIERLSRLAADPVDLDIIKIETPELVD